MHETNESSTAADLQTRQWSAFIHLAQLGNFLLPFGGLVAVIVIWQMKKNELPGINQHAHMVLNWQISAFIYSIVGALLTLILVGFLALLVLAVCAVVFAIIGAIKANEGELWQYPLTLQILK